MKITLIGYSGYVGQNINNSLSNLEIEELNLINSKTTISELELYISQSDLVINCAAIQRPLKNNFESFYPNYELTKRIVDNISENSKLIFVSSIHFRNKSHFGIIRKMEEDYIKSKIKNFTIYHLPHTFGPYGKPNYNNVFNTLIFNVSNNLEIKIQNFSEKFPLISIETFSNLLVSNINKDLFEVDNFETYNMTLPNFLFLLSNISLGNSSNEIIYSELIRVYNWYKNK